MKKFFTIIFIAVVSCGSDDRVDDPIPFQHFPDFSITTSLPAYNALLINGGYVTVPYSSSSQVGIKGIIIYRENATTFRTFEQNCSFQPNDASANVQAYPTYMLCSGCGSKFDYEGNPMDGLAWRPLGQYETKANGSNITITDEVINY